MKLALDLDGTLITCEARHTTVLNALLKAYGLAVDMNLFWRSKRRGASTRRALEFCGLTSRMAAEIGALWQAHIEEPTWLTLDRVFANVRTILGIWQAKRIGLQLVTARSRPEWLMVQIRHLDMGRFFDTIWCVPPATASESKAEILRVAKVQLFIGDTESDARAAETAGVPFAAVATGLRDADFLRKSGVAEVFESLDQLACRYQFTSIA